MFRPSTVTIEMMPLRTAWRITTRRSEMPLERAVVM